MSYSDIIFIIGVILIRLIKWTIINIDKSVAWLGYTFTRKLQFEPLEALIFFSSINQIYFNLFYLACDIK